MDSVTTAVDPTVMRAHHRLGTVLRGKWTLDRLLGVGGMAAVYSATHRNGTRAAVKMLHPELSTHGHVRSRFMKEGYVANKVDHPGVVRVLDDDQAEDGSLFLVMELLVGESLEERRERHGGHLEPDEVLAATDQLLDVLAAAHEKGIVHRDIKPENVFLTRDGVIKVLDFGIARLRELSTASSATRAGTTMGTPAFMAPEQARGLWDEVDARSDLWSVGATMFTLLTGRQPHQGRTTNEILLAAMTQEAPPLKTVSPELPHHVAAVVDRALASDKARRWPDARSMQEAVRKAFHTVHGAPISTNPKLTVPPIVPDRTLPSADGALPVGLASVGTGPAVASGQTGIPLRRSTASRVPGGAFVVAGIAGIGAILLLAIVVIKIVVPGITARSAGAGAAASSSANATTTLSNGGAEREPSRDAGLQGVAASAVPTSSNSTPTVALEDLPTARPPVKSGTPPPSTATPAGTGAKPLTAPPGGADWKEQRR